MDIGVGLEGLALKRTIGGREGLYGDVDSVDPLLPNTQDNDAPTDGDWASNGDWAEGDWLMGNGAG